MQDLLNSSAESLARSTQSRRRFLARVAQGGMALFAALAAHSAFDKVIVGEAGTCSPPCGQYCSTYGYSCNSSGGCTGGCYYSYRWYPNSGGCWTVGGTRCCDCRCPGHFGNPSCYEDGSHQGFSDCGCHN